jgi:hypothetical protein
MPKQRAHPHHHSLRGRRLRQRGLQLPDPIIPSDHFGLRFIPRIIPPGWRFQPPAPFIRGYGIIVLLIVGFAIITALCAVGQLVVGAIAR